MNGTYIGNLVRDVEIRTTSTGVTVSNFTVAVNEKLESDKEITTYLDFEAWGYKALDSSELKKGNRVIVVAVPRNDVWEKDGKKFSKIKFRVIEVGICPRVKKLDQPVDTADDSEAVLVGAKLPF